LQTERLNPAECFDVRAGVLIGDIDLSEGSVLVACGSTALPPVSLGIFTCMVLTSSRPNEEHKFAVGRDGRGYFT
jgi:hypothetical protein